jgi:hypothetical protein
LAERPIKKPPRSLRARLKPILETEVIEPLQHGLIEQHVNRLFIV